MILAHGSDFSQSYQRSPARVKKAVQGLFFQMLMKEMQRGQGADLLGSGPAASMTRDLVGQVVASHLSGQIDLGVVSQLGEQIDVQQPSSVGTVPGIRAPSGTSALPVDGHISSGYGYRRDPINGDRRFHHGVDIAAPRGSPIQSISPGVVVFAGEMGGYGLAIKVRQADGATVLYGHCDSVDTRVGTRVGPGEVIGRVGSTGRSTGPHLHLEIRRRGESLDPQAYLSSRSPAAIQVARKGDD